MRCAQVAGPKQSTQESAALSLQSVSPSRRALSHGGHHCQQPAARGPPQAFPAVVRVSPVAEGVGAAPPPRHGGAAWWRARLQPPVVPPRRVGLTQPPHGVVAHLYARVFAVPGNNRTMSQAAGFRDTLTVRCGSCSRRDACPAAAACEYSVGCVTQPWQKPWARRRTARAADALRVQPGCILADIAPGHAAARQGRAPCPKQASGRQAGRIQAHVWVRQDGKVCSLRPQPLLDQQRALSTRGHREHTHDYPADAGASFGL